MIAWAEGVRLLIDARWGRLIDPLAERVWEPGEVLSRCDRRMRRFADLGVERGSRVFLHYGQSPRILRRPAGDLAPRRLRGSDRWPVDRVRGRDAREGGPTAALGVGRDVRIRSSRARSQGSAPLSASLWRQIQEWTGARAVMNAYGITETGSWLAGTTLGDFEPEDGLVREAWGRVV